ncbi:hypothetical protein [Caldivirga sp. MU80]|uniref:hypothetical protein n=1 Tax=Caldivirga sp. MU80 TaxID=1650354 RepID=UPI0008349463|nr:hypothetical protein [Caldivirga sp. MU80]
MGRAQFVGGDVVVEYLVDEAMNNVVAKRRFENDTIRVLYDGGRRAIGVMGGSKDSLTVGLAELYRALNESKVPEPQVTELLVSYTDRLTVCPDRSIEFGNFKLQQRGYSDGNYCGPCLGYHLLLRSIAITMVVHRIHQSYGRTSLELSYCHI